MFGNKRRAMERRIAELEARIESLETIRTPEYGNIPASMLWMCITRYAKDQVKRALANT